jgi:hypothetical protein
VLANIEFRPAINPLKLINTENITAIRKGDEVTDDCYLALPTLAEMMQQQGLRTAIAGSKGVAVLHDRKPRAGENPAGLALFANATLPESLWPQLTNRFGSPPTNTSQRHCATSGRCVAGRRPGGTAACRILAKLMSEPTPRADHRPGRQSPSRRCGGVDRNLALLLANSNGARTARQDRRDCRLRPWILDDRRRFRHGGQVGTGRSERSSHLAELLRAIGDVVVAGTGGAVMLYVIGRQKKSSRKP